MKGRVPYKCVYHATEPTVARVAENRVAREFRKFYVRMTVAFVNAYNMSLLDGHTWNADDDEASVDA